MKIEKTNDLVHSLELREKLIANEEVLDKIKAVPLFPNEMFVGTMQAANYYGVKQDTIKGVIKRHREELVSDGMVIISGPELLLMKELKAIDDVSNKEYIGNMCRAYTKISKRGLLRIGMILQKSEVAEKIRDYLLNIEEDATMKSKIKATVKVVNNTFADALKIEVKELALAARKEEALAKKELSKVNKSMKKLEMYGIGKIEAARMVQESIIYNSNTESMILDKLKEIEDLDITKARGRIRLKVDKIAVLYYNEDREMVYYILSERMKYIMGVDMRSIRTKLKKSGKKEKEIPSYLDIIAEYRENENAEKLLDLIVDECIEAIKKPKNK